MKEKIIAFLKKYKYKVLLCLVLVLYTIISFFKLGNNYNPQTFVTLKSYEQVEYKIPKDTIIYRLQFFSGPNVVTTKCYFTNDYENQEYWGTGVDCNSDYANVLKWNDVYFSNIPSCDYLVIQSYADSTIIGEIRAYDANENEIKLEAVSERAERLLDEQDTVPKDYSYMNSTYFDEVYFPRTVYEIMNNTAINEYTHPPLGKLIMSIPVYFWGLTPFSYRFLGNVCGILMILVIYEIAKVLFKKEKYALFAAIIMALDGMHFVQTRIGTVDSYLVLFCLTSFLFFLKYLSLDKDKEFKYKITSLLISGTFWGMAISVKWTAFFVGAGLGVMWLFSFFMHNEYKRKGHFSPAIILWSILGFVIIPISIYVASYIPIINNPNSELTYYTSEKDLKKGKSQETFTVKIHDVKSFLDYQGAMYNYHSELQLRKVKNNEEAHAFSSEWYTWPFMKRPLWFYCGRFYNDDGSLEKYGTIACMGNPAIWWLGIITTIFTLVYSLIKRNKEGLILILMIAITWLTYAFIKREMFIYHYFITLPFVMLTIVFAFSKLIEWKNKFKIILPILCTVFLGFFIYFYPVYSGIPVDPQYIEKTKWFKAEYHSDTKKYDNEWGKSWYY